jgi:transmembrane sensor
MTKFTKRDWLQLGTLMQLDWTASHFADIKKHIRQRQDSQQRRRPVIATLSVLACCGVAALIIGIFAPSVKEETSRHSQSDSRERIGDAQQSLTPIPDFLSSKGAAAVETVLEAGTDFRVEEGVTERTYWVSKGRLRFDTGSFLKRISVRVGSLVIEDIGTVFEVEAILGAKARIHVSEGKVKVLWPEGRDVLEAGQEGTYPPDSAPRERVRASDKGSRSFKETEDWRVLAKHGLYQQAYRIIDRNPGQVSNDVGDLMLAADVMRLSGRSARSVKYLNRVVQKHTGDPRAGLAAFTLGRVYLSELHRPRMAARAFARVQKFKTPLSEEAMAREVEALSRAGETERAGSVARQYLRQYPGGVHVKAVRAFGGLSE